MADMDIKEVKEKVGKGLEFARWKLLDRSPFIGEMLLRFSIIPTYDCRINTAATDGSKIYFDCEFYSKLTEGQREFVLAHEVWHNIYLHFMRQMGRDHELWNIATDMEINHMLKNEGMDVLEDACMPEPIVAGKNAEDIYAYLKKEQEKQQQQQNQKNNSSSSSSSSSSNGDGEGDGEGQDDEGDSDGSSSSSSSSSNGNKNQKGGKGGKPNNKHGNQFDKHIYEGENAGEGDGEKDGKWGKKGIDADCNPQMKDGKATEDKIKDIVCAVAQSIERKQGHLPAGIDNLVKEMLKPEINWREQLSMFVTSCLGGEHSWKRVSRHALARGNYLPGRNSEKIKVCLILDTSGSYLQDMPKFLAEFKALVGSFGQFSVDMIQCDCEVQDVTHYDNDMPMDFNHFKAKGGGGSDFRPAFKKMREIGEPHDVCVAFTDGYIDVPTYDPGVPTLFVLPNDGHKDFCEWGRKMVYKPEKKEY